MSNKQKQPVEIICPSCLVKRVVQFGQLQKKMKKGNLKCRSCQRQGHKMSDEARGKMSQSKKALVLSGWHPGRPFPKGHVPWIKGKKGLLKYPKRTHRIFECLRCGEEFRPDRKTSQFCSYQCSNRYRVEQGTHHFWKGGITPINFSVRSMTEYKKWKQEVIARDGYKCQECGVESVEGRFRLMHVDHIKPLSFLINKLDIKTVEGARNCKELWNTDNGRILCRVCHEGTPTFLFRARNYKSLTT